MKFQPVWLVSEQIFPHFFLDKATWTLDACSLKVLGIPPYSVPSLKPHLCSSCSGPRLCP